MEEKKAVKFYTTIVSLIFICSWFRKPSFKMVTQYLKIFALSPRSLLTSPKTEDLIVSQVPGVSHCLLKLPSGKELGHLTPVLPQSFLLLFSHGASGTIRSSDSDQPMAVVVRWVGCGEAS